MDNIKPCPFCGYDKCRVEQNVFDDLKYCVHCPSCGDESSGYEHPGSAAKAWNMRTVAYMSGGSDVKAQLTTLREQVGKLADELDGRDGIEAVEEIRSALRAAVGIGEVKS